VARNLQLSLQCWQQDNTKISGYRHPSEH
jgi:hypothetical protein